MQQTENVKYHGNETKSVRLGENTSLETLKKFFEGTDFEAICWNRHKENEPAFVGSMRYRGDVPFHDARRSCSMYGKGDTYMLAIGTRVYPFMEAWRIREEYGITV